MTGLGPHLSCPSPIEIIRLGLGIGKGLQTAAGHLVDALQGHIIQAVEFDAVHYCNHVAEPSLNRLNH
jgi:hypothetical protein